MSIIAWAVIPFTPPPVLEVGPLQFSAHGAAFLIAALTALYFTKKRLAPHLHNAIEDAIPAMLLGAVIGARGLFFMQQPRLWSTPWEFFAFWKGGLVSYGGMLGAILGLVAYARRRKLPLATLSDALAPAALVGWGIGRIGCFLSWYDEYGKPSTLPWAFSVSGDSRHPVMLYLSLALILSGLWLMRIPSKRPYSLTGLSFISYGLIRIILDEWRDYSPPSLLWYSRAACFAIALYGLRLYFKSLAAAAGSSGKKPIENVELDRNNLEVDGEQGVG